MPALRLPAARWRLIGDGALAGALLAAGLAETWAALPSRDGPGNPWWTTLSVLAATVPLVVRRSHPLLMVIVAGAGISVLYALAPVYVLFYGQFVPAAVAIFSVARHGRGRVPFYGAAVGAVVTGVLTAAVPTQRGAGSVAFNVVFLALAWLAGWGLAEFERRAAVARQHAVDTEVAAATLALAAVAAERSRIARELHDIVAHAVSMIVVQAGAAEPMVTEDPAYVAAVLGTIRATGADALAEMRRVVAMLREADDPQPLSPQPGVESIPGLIEHARRSGLRASLVIDGEPGALPAGLGLAAYRIVQEALSNVRRHAAATQAWVRLTYAPDSLRLEVRDDGVGADEVGARGAPGGGHGLIGMRERAALYGGELETSSQAGHGFTVAATLPLAAP